MNKQEQKEIHRQNILMTVRWDGGGQREKVKGLRKTNRQLQNSHGV